MARLMGLQFQIVYKKGTENLVADALSRRSTVMQLAAFSEVQPAWVQEVINSYATDSEAQELITHLLIQNPDENGFSLKQGIIRREGKYGLVPIQLFAPNSFLLCMTVLRGVTQGSKQPISGSREFFGGGA